MLELPSVTLSPFLQFTTLLPFFLFSFLLLPSPFRPVDSLMVSWKRDGRRLASGRRLIIPAPTSSDTGLYVCEALLSNSTAKPVEARAHLTVMGKKKSHSQTCKHTQCLTWLSMIILGRPDPSSLMPSTCAINSYFNVAVVFPCTFFAPGTVSLCLFLHLFPLFSCKHDCEHPGQWLSTTGLLELNLLSTHTNKLPIVVTSSCYISVHTNPSKYSHKYMHVCILHLHTITKWHHRHTCLFARQLN